MTEIESCVARIKELTENYRPSEETMSALSGKTIVPIVAPFGVGKTSLMLRMEEQDKSFAYVRGFVTRPPRSDNEAAYRFRAHDTASLNEIISELENGELVQAIIHPTNNYVYGSDLASYAATNNVLDVLTSALDALKLLGFKRIQSIYLICSVEDWIKRLSSSQQTETMSAHRIRERWLEATISLQYAIGNPTEFSWLENKDGELDKACQRAIEMTKAPISAHYGNEISMARAMLDYASKQL